MCEGLDGHRPQVPAPMVRRGYSTSRAVCATGSLDPMAFPLDFHRYVAETHIFSTAPDRYLEVRGVERS